MAHQQSVSYTDSTTSVRQDCLHCGDEFTATHGLQRVCSHQCSKDRAAEKWRDANPRQEPETLVKDCEECGDRFNTTAKIQRYCSKACGNKHHNKIWKGYAKTCKECDAAYTTKHTEQMYCSRECGYQGREFVMGKRGKRTVSPEQHHLKGVIGIIRRLSISTNHHARVRKYREAREKRLDLITAPDRECLECGCSIDASSTRIKYCSGKCGKKKDKRVSRAKRRARVRSARVESVDPIKVLERDGWSCQLCGIDTPRELRGTYDNASPELDHVIPLAANGEHSYANTQCLCRECNQRKGSAMPVSAETKQGGTSPSFISK